MFKAYQCWGKLGSVSDVLQQLNEEEGTVVQGIFRQSESGKAKVGKFTLPSLFEDDSYWEFQKGPKVFLNRFKFFSRHERRQKQKQSGISS